MEIANATAAASQANARASGNDAGILTSDFETFLTMLTTQMQNQDPLEPMKSDELSVQLATFSGVEQQVRTNDLLGNLGLQLGAMSLGQLAGWVGMEARSLAPLTYDGAPLTVPVKAASLADQAAVIVRNDAGQEVSRAPIPVGQTSYTWDGLASNGTGLPHGAYTFEVESSRNGDVVATNRVETYARVTEVRNDAGSTTLVLEGGSTISADEVTALREAI